MLLKALQTAVSDRARGHERRRRADVLPLSRPHVGKSTAADWMAAYPCTRMHGADFEAEFYAERTEL